LDTSYNPLPRQILERAGHIRREIIDLTEDPREEDKVENEENEADLAMPVYQKWHDLALSAVMADISDKKLDRMGHKVPRNFNEAWNHPEEQERLKWREAIKKEFGDMNRRNVWRKVKKSKMTKD